MDDKILAHMDLMLAQAIAALAECRRALVVSGAVTPEQSVRNQSQLDAGATASQTYMSGRWHRRDGNIFGIQSQRLKAPGDLKDADSSPGNIRPTDER